MARNPIDYFVLYNSALSNETETDDTRLSLEFTRHLVNMLEEDRKRVGYVEYRDALPGRDVFDVLHENITRSRKRIVVFTSGFILNRWEKFASKMAFKSHNDSDKTEHFIAIGLCIRENEKPPEINRKQWIHFEADYAEQNATNGQKWNQLRMAVDFKESCSHGGIQECGDNRLLTDRRNLVTQPTEFFSDSLIMDIAENFADNWRILCIKLGLKDITAEKIASNHQNDSGKQAFKGLNLSLNSQGGNDESKIDRLIKVFRNMGRRDLIENVEKKYQEYQEQNSQSNKCQGGPVQVVSEEQQNAQDASDILDNSADLSPKSRPVSIGAGPSVISSETSSVNSGQSGQSSENFSNNSNMSSSNQTSPPIKPMEPVRNKESGDADNGQRSGNDDTTLKMPFQNPCSLPNEDDITIDDGAASSIQQNEDQPTKPSAGSSHPLDQTERFKYLNNDPMSTDSGLGSSANTLILDNVTCSGSRTESVLNSSKTKENELNATQVKERIASAMNQTSTQLTSADLTVNSSYMPVHENKETGNQHMALQDGLEFRSSNNGYSPPTDRNAVNSSLGSKFCVMVWNLMTRPELAYN